MICISAAVTHHTCPNPFIPSRTIKTILLSTRSFFITSTRLRSGVSRDSSSLLVFAMDFMKVLDQAVREIKREVNLKVLNVPEIEQKVLDATSTEPWGPHGSALSEIAQASKKFTECSMIMNVLWTRLSETGANWRHVYKALTVIEYLIANGSERAVDDIIEHTFKISSLSGFAYVEPNGKDSGINVRKKVETLVALLNDKDKIQAARNKAAANRDKYIGLSSSGITYKSSASSFGSSSYQSNDRYGGFGSSKEGDSFKDSSEGYGKESKWSSEKKNVKSTEGLSNEKAGSKLKKGGARGHDSLSAHSSKTAIKSGQISSSSSPSVQPSSEDDFDPRGSSKANNSSSNQVDLFGESLVGDLMDAPASAPTETATLNNIVTPEVDLFADATFVSASPHTEATTVSLGQGDIDFFTSSPDFPAAVPTNVDLFGASDFDVASKAKSSSPMTTHTDAFDPFAASDSGAHSKVKSSASESTGTKSFDPFAGIPMNNFEGADPFGALTSHTEEATLEPPKNLANNSNLEQTSVTSSKPAPKNNSFQVKSGIWADSLSRGLIDLNITAPKKTNLADIGIVGGLGDVSDDKEKVVPPTAFYMGTAMGAGTGLDRSGFPSTTKGASGNFLPFGQQQFGSFK